MDSTKVRAHAMQDLIPYTTWYLFTLETPSTIVWTKSQLAKDHYVFGLLVVVWYLPPLSK